MAVKVELCGTDTIVYATDFDMDSGIPALYEVYIPGECFIELPLGATGMSEVVLLSIAEDLVRYKVAEGRLGARSRDALEKIVTAIRILEADDSMDN